MPKVTAARIALTALVLVSLTGCAGSAEEAPTEPRGFAQTAPSQTPEPLDAETPEPVASPTPTTTWTMDEIRIIAGWRNLPESARGDVTEEQVIAAAHSACDQLEAGVAPDAVDVELGDWDEINSVEDGMVYSVEVLCPDVAPEG